MHNSAKEPGSGKIPGSGNHMSVGQIYYSIHELLNPKTNLLSQINTSLLSLITEADLRIIQQFAFLAKDIRGSSGHGGIIDYTKCKNVLPSLIETLNKSLIVFNKMYPK